MWRVNATQSGTRYSAVTLGTQTCFRVGHFKHSNGYSKASEAQLEMSQTDEPKTPRRRMKQLQALPRLEVGSSVDAHLLLTQLDQLRERILSTYPNAGRGRELESIHTHMQDTPLPGSVDCHSPQAADTNGQLDEKMRKLVRDEVMRVIQENNVGAVEDDAENPRHKVALKRRNRHEDTRNSLADNVPFEINGRHGRSPTRRSGGAEGHRSSNSPRPNAKDDVRCAIFSPRTRCPHIHCTSRAWPP